MLNEVGEKRKRMVKKQHTLHDARANGFWLKSVGKVTTLQRIHTVKMEKRARKIDSVNNKCTHFIHSMTAL